MSLVLGCVEVEACSTDGIAEGSVLVKGTTLLFSRPGDDNPQPVSIEDFSRCTTLTGNLILMESGTESSALASLTLVEGHVSVGSEFRAQEDVLPALEFIAGTLIIEASGDFTGFNSVERLTAVYLTPISRIARLQILNNLEITSAGIRINAEEVNGFRSLRSAEALLIEGAASLDAFENLETLNGPLWVENSSLESLPFESLETIGGDLRLIENSRLTFSGLERVRSVGDLAIGNNPRLSTNDLWRWIDELDSVGAVVTCGNLGDVSCDE